MVELKGRIPLIVGQTFLFVFVQKYLFGINAFEPSGVSLYSYYGYFLVALSILVLLFAFFSSKIQRLVSKGSILIVSLLSIPISACLLFDFIGLLDSAIQLNALVICLSMLSLCYCFVQFAWLDKLKESADSQGGKPVILCVLAAAFIYSVITPSDINDTIYMILLETAALPAVAICYCLLKKPPLKKVSDAKPFNKEGLGYLTSASLFLLIMLLLSYVDVLNPGYPEVHQENPTFYALLLIATAGIFALQYKDYKAGASLSFSAQQLIQIFCVFFLLTYIFVFYYAASSYEFCFQFTCFIRRLIAVIFFAEILSLALIYNYRIEICIGVMFLVPYFLAKAVMMFLMLPVKEGTLSNLPEFRLIVLLVLGVMLVLFVSYYWYFHSRTNPISLYSENETQDSSPHAFRIQAINSLSQKYTLSKRESDVLYYLSMGYSLKGIASALYIAENTAGTHVQSIYKKLNLHSKQDVIDAANSEMGL